MSDRVQRWSSILVGAAVVAVVGWLTLEQRPRRRAEVDGAAPTAPATGAPAEAASGAAPSAPAVETEGGAELALPSLFGDGGSLPSGAPRTVHLGVVLVQFAGAEGASSSARAKRDAFEEAEKLAALAKTDFKKAVKDGDTGSSEDIGRIPRGVLDPRTEVTVFSLAPGAVSDVLETPKGYWIVKRIE